MSRINFFTANSSLTSNAIRVFGAYVESASIDAYYADRIKSLKNTIRTAEGSINSEFLIAECKNQLSDIVSERAEFKKSVDRFAFDADADKAFLELYPVRNCTPISYDDALTSVRTFFKSYGLIIDGTKFEDACMLAVDLKDSKKLIVKSNGSKSLVINGKKTLEQLYKVTFEWLCERNMVTPAKVYNELAIKYAVKKVIKNK